MTDPYDSHRHGPSSSPERDALLATKFHIPQLHSDLLTRPRLLDQLEQAVAYGLLLVSAPAGFGKSSLLAEWARNSDRPVGWVSLDVDDNDPVRFWRCVAAAIEQARAGLEEKILPLLRAADQLAPEAIVTAMVNELAARPAEFTVVLDDYHVIESQAVQRSLAFLLEHLPPGMHVVIAGRSDPPIPLARMRARGQLAEVRAHDLRFSPQEAAVLLRERWRLRLSEASISALDDRTEGWVTGFQLVALAVQGQADPTGFIKEFTGSNRFVLDYLTEEVLERQPAYIRSFLLETSMLERFTAALCDAVTGRSDGRQMLEVLDQANLFLVALDDERRWYRYHHLFADALRTRLRQASSERVAELHRRAAAWCRDHGLVHDALRYSMAANEPNWAAELVEDSVDEILGLGEGATLRAWLSALPEAVVRSRPRLCLAQAIAAFNAGRLDEVEPLLGAAEHGLNVRHDRLPAPHAGDQGALANVPALVTNLRASLAWARGDIEETIRLAQEARTRLSEDERDPLLPVQWNLALAVWMQGHMVDAERAFAEIVKIGRSAGSSHLALSAGVFLGRVQRSQGKLGAALRTHQDGLDFASRSGHPAVVTIGTAHIGLAGVHYERNQLDKALRHVEEGIALCRQLTSSQPLASGLATLAWIRQATGDSDGAIEAMEEACRVLPSRDVVSLYHPVPADRARLLVARGDVAAAAGWVQERGLQETDELRYTREPEYLVLARVLLAREAPDRASNLLKRIGALAEAQGRSASVLEISVLRALGLHAMGDRSGALDTLARPSPSATPRATSGSSPTRDPPWPRSWER